MAAKSVRDVDWHMETDDNSEEIAGADVICDGDAGIDCASDGWMSDDGAGVDEEQGEE